MVSYLLIIVGLSLIVGGITYNFTSDIVDISLSSLSTVYSTDSKFTMDADSIESGNMLLILFKFCLIPILICLAYFSWVISQKPERAW